MKGLLLPLLLRDSTARPRAADGCGGADDVAGVVRSMEEAMAAPTPTRRPQEEVFHAQMGEDKFVLNR